MAAKKAPDDPRILAAAYWLHFQLGRDDEADHTWLTRASKLSSTDKGPLWRVSLQDVIAEWIPKRRDHLGEVERKWLNGEIPTSMAAGILNGSLTRLLLHIPDQNASELDGRRRVILPLIAGGRNPIELQDNWTIGLDVTSVMVLTYLGLLEQTVDAFHHIKLAPGLMECLFMERNEVRFHQPSRIKAAKRVLELRSREQIRAADNLTTPPEAVTDEVGFELATLLQIARHDNGTVICVFPIHRVGSLMEEQADTSKYDDLILSTMDICTLCHDEGKIDAADYQRACLSLNNQGPPGRVHFSRSILDGPIYIDRTALSCLQNASMLQPMAAAGLDIRVHPDVLGDMNALIEAGDVSDDLVKKIEQIQNVFRNALESGAASLLPRTADQDERSQNRDIRFQARASLLAGSTGCDALCIDDRFINSHPFQAEPTGRSVPIVCVLDVLRYLVDRGCIDLIDHWIARHKLRQAGFAFIPLDSDELGYWLKAARVNNGHLTENVELRVLRQTMAHIDTLSLAAPRETISLSSVSTGVPNACKGAVENLWKDTALTIEQISILSDWVWRHLWAAPLWGHQHVSADAYTDRIRELLSVRLEHLLLPTVIQPYDRRAHYIHWIERTVELLQPANADIIEKALTSACEAISALDEDRAYGYLFLNNLPETLRSIVLNRDPEFGRRFGFKNQRIFSIGTNLKLTDSDLFEAAREVLATNRAKSVQDVTLNKASVDLDMEDQNIVVKWSDADGVSYRETLPELALLSTKPELRITAIRSLIERFGPTAPDFKELLNNMETRKANHQELSAIFKESANGIAALQSRLIQKINSGSFSVVDVIPQSVSYFERFVGPAPGTPEPETYFKEVLVPRRKALLSSNIDVGLDICCLGALRDDLAPGQWVTAIEDDAVWQALSSCHAESNPFSLLGALDVALYRQQDRRFREFSATAVATLLDVRFGQQDGPDIYELLQLFADFVLNRINALENGPHYPGYWKRLCAWIHAGLIVRVLTGASFPIDNSRLQEWTHSNMDAAGNFAGHIDARTEPLFFAGNMTPQTLRNEILRRLYILKSRHESEGRQVPQSRDIEHQLALPGPLEGHKRPTEPVPQEVTEQLKDASTDSAELSPMPLLVTASQLFALGSPELDFILQSVRKIAENNAPTELRENLKLLELAGIVAAATREPRLANGIAEAVVRVASRTSEEEDIELIFRIMLRAAAAYEAHDVWCKWLEESLASIATHLPPPPNQCLRMFLDRLDELERVSPIESWFHVRAKSQAMAGAE